jgi:hypothetical protein
MPAVDRILVVVDGHIQAAAGHSHAVALVGMASGCGWDLRSHVVVALVGTENGCDLDRSPGHSAAEGARCSLGAAGMNREVGAGMRPSGRSVEARYRNAPTV